MQTMLDEEGRPAGPRRVYLRETNIPGLAVSRCFGDYGEQCGAEEGVWSSNGANQSTRAAVRQLRQQMGGCTRGLLGGLAGC
jgi:hypothetical protein